MATAPFGDTFLTLGGQINHTEPFDLSEEPFVAQAYRYEPHTEEWTEVGRMERGWKDPTAFWIPR